LPILLKTLELLRKEVDFESILLWAPTLNEKEFEIENIQIVKENRYAAMQSCDFLFVASGTSTLETAILGVPFVIVYRVGDFSWELGKILVRVPYYGLVNWIAQEKVVAEFIQDRMDPELLAAEAQAFLKENEKQQNLKMKLQKLVESLGPPGAMERATDEILKRLVSMERRL
jgi:lipid-A-disaccharide synthase